MKVSILKECGYEQALLGLSLSFYDHKIPLEEFWTNERFEKAKKIAIHLANKEVPEDYETRNNLAYISAEQKFLEQIDTWIYIQASRGWWIEMATYRVDTSTQRSSTMHTLDKREAVKEDFLNITILGLDAFNACLKDYKNPNHKYYKNIEKLKCALPEGFLSEGVFKTSYKTLKWILEQRDGHRLESWKIFNKEIYNQIEHPEFIKLIEN